MQAPASILRNLKIGTDICNVQRIYDLLTQNNGRLGRRFAEKILVAQERNDERAKVRLSVLGDAKGLMCAGWDSPGTRSNASAKDSSLSLTRTQASEMMRTAEFLAGRFAAKEAAIKAHHDRRLTFQDIWIRKRPTAPGRSGAPEAVIRGEDGSWEGGEARVVPVSVSHDGGVAQAVCMAEEVEEVEERANNGGGTEEGKVEDVIVRSGVYGRVLTKRLDQVRILKAQLKRELDDEEALMKRLQAARRVNAQVHSSSLAQMAREANTRDPRTKTNRWLKQEPGQMVRKHWTRSPLVRPVLASLRARDAVSGMEVKNKHASVHWSRWLHGSKSPGSVGAKKVLLERSSVQDGPSEDSPQGEPSVHIVEVKSKEPRVESPVTRGISLIRKYGAEPHKGSGAEATATVTIPDEKVSDEPRRAVVVRRTTRPSPPSTEPAHFAEPLASELFQASSSSTIALPEKVSSEASLAEKFPTANPSTSTDAGSETLDTEDFERQHMEWLIALERKKLDRQRLRLDIKQAKKKGNNAKVAELVSSLPPPRIRKNDLYDEMTPEIESENYAKLLSDAAKDWETLVFNDEIFVSRSDKVDRAKAREIEGRLRRTLFVRNVDVLVEPRELEAHFGNDGAAKCRAYIYKTEAGDHLGTAAIVYTVNETAYHAQKIYNNSCLRRRIIQVSAFLSSHRIFAKHAAAVRLSNDNAVYSQSRVFDRGIYKQEPLPHHVEHGGSCYIRVERLVNLSRDTHVRRERGVWISGVPAEATARDIEMLFAGCSGSEVTATVLHGRDGRSTGVAVVVVGGKNEAKIARVEMDGRLLCGRKIRVRDGPT